MVNSLADYFQAMIDKILRYHSDHNASYEEAKVLARYYSDIENHLRSVSSRKDISLAISYVEHLKKMTDRHRHSSKKYQWSYTLEKEVLAKLKVLMSNPRPNLMLVEDLKKINRSNPINLTDLDQATVNKISDYLNGMTDKIIHYHKDHNASKQEAEVIFRYYSELSNYVEASGIMILYLPPLKA